MNLDVQLFILEKLDLLTLSSVAGTNQYFSFLVEDVFRRKNAKKLFKIVDPRLEDYEPLLETEDTIYMRQLDVILRILKQFGGLISHLEFDFSDGNRFLIDAESVNIICESINRHCSYTLKHFDISNYHANFFDKMIKPFAKVEILSIVGQFNNLSSNTLNFVQLFPALRQLKLGYIYVRDTSCINRKFPRLKQLHVEISQHTMSSKFDENDIFNLLKKNPQICNLKLGIIGNELLLQMSQSEFSPNEMDLNLNLDVKDDAILSFIKNNKQSKKIQFTRHLRPFSFNRVTDILNNQYADKWTINESLYSIELERV